MRKIPPAPRQQALGSDVQKVADLLVRAKNPVITTESGGREQEGYDALIELADLLSIPVVESPVSTVANFPRDNALHQGFNIQPFLDSADLVLMVRNRVPWYPPKKGPSRATVVAIDENPFKTHMVYQNLHADRYLEGDVPSSLKMLAQAVRASRIDAAEIKTQRARWSKAHDQIDTDFRTAVASARRSSGIHPANLCATLGEVLPRNTIYVDETTSHRGQVHQFVQNHGRLSFVRVPSGLGQCLGVSLGIKIASPDRPVVALIGDGAFVYNPVVAGLAFAKHANLPIMVIVFNNRGYRGMRDNHLAFYPDGVAARHRMFYGEMLDSSDYHELARAFGGVGIRVEDPSKLNAALKKGHEAVKNGKLAIVNALLEA
jgi:acetolactate synthase-1/2/3 large subunit